MIPGYHLLLIHSSGKWGVEKSEEKVLECEEKALQVAESAKVREIELGGKLITI